MITGGDDSDIEILYVKPAQKRKEPEPAIPSTPSSSATGVSSSSSHSTSFSKPKPAKKSKKKMKPHILLWVPTNGKGQRKAWSQLKVMGVFPSKEKAQEKKDELMEKYETYGHGDICVGGTWDDEIDLVIKPCELFLDDDDE
jgi:hypothetical protein